MTLDVNLPTLENCAQAYSSGKYDRPGYEQVLNKEQTIRNHILNFGGQIFSDLYDLIVGTAYGGELSNIQIAEQHYKNGKTHYNKKEYVNALAEYELAVKYDPINSRYFNNLGVILTKLNNYDEAIKVFEKGIDINPSDPMSICKASLFSSS